MDQFPWKVRCFYAQGVVKGGLHVGNKKAIETVHATESSARIEVEAARKREEIGRVEVLFRGRGRKEWMEVTLT